MSGRSQGERQRRSLNMKERDTVTVSALVLLLTLGWLGFIFHHSERFAGSLAGGIFAIIGTAFMLIPLLYMIIKRISALRKRVLSIMTMRTFLAIHIYAGIIGPIFIIIHTGHKFESVIGIFLTAFMLVIVFSGFIGRYLMKHISSELREKRDVLRQLNVAYETVSQELCAQGGPPQQLRPYANILRRFFLNIFVDSSVDSLRTSPPVKAVKIVESIADIEYSIKTHEKFKLYFKRWLKVHIYMSLVFYIGIVLHIWAAIHFGIRWF